ncbi:IS110 family transposase [Deinococcus cellulosilyticus]|uniref:IS110 family transposase n=1 Tax=Deinococcus cellulosilyticus (strain DSM 18568 / NBRC 106333 / KACC 11606 / 5516J-15) TaxID=1223518 RepID=A0A511NC57_DEIC1|nr:IS110 family transposase [Deinococcus cellulosilyticus]GEM50156.1 IS110 family transposase [Deinococcus cellulosilyticus NBRC 106333 = KACC 11606]
MFILGIDVGKSELYCRLLQTTEKGVSKLGGIQMFPNTEEGRYCLKQWLEGHQALGDTTHAVMEATGVYSQRIAHAIYTAGCQVSVVNGAQIKYFARTKLRRGKTDKMDAELIAQYGLIMKPAVWQPTRDELEHLRALMSERDAIQTLITMEKGRHHAMDHQQNPCLTVVERCEARQKLLGEQLDQVDEEIKNTIQNDAILKAQVDLLCSIPGVGLLTASILLTETHHLENLETAKQWAAYAGLSPVPRESGQFKGRTTISKVGNKKIRNILYLSALTVSRMHNEQTEFYQRLVEAGKPKKVALIALARKILRICFAVLRSGEPYAAGHRSQPALPA